MEGEIIVWDEEGFTTRFSYIKLRTSYERSVPKYQNRYVANLVSEENGE